MREYERARLLQLCLESIVLARRLRRVEGGGGGWWWSVVVERGGSGWWWRVVEGGGGEGWRVEEGGWRCPHATLPLGSQSR